MRTNTPKLPIGVLTAIVIAVTSVGLKPVPAAAEGPATTEEVLAVPAATGGEPVTIDGAQLAVRYALNKRSGLRFSLLALTWTAHSGPAATMQFRTVTDGAWTQWTTADSSDDVGGALEGTDPFFTSDSTGVEVRVLGAPTTVVSGLKLRLIDPRAATSDAKVAQAPRAGTSVTRAGAQPQAASSGSFLPKPTIISRAGWGANEALLSTNGADCVPPNWDSTVQAAIVHHTAGSNNYQAADSARIVRGIYYYHVVSRGWCDIGYNFLVDKYGQVFEGRHGGTDYPVHGAHASSWNTNTMGISVMMNSSTMQPTTASINALVNVIAWKLGSNYRDPASTVTLAGKRINRIAQHGDVMSTDCAGTGISAQMPSIRTRVAGVVNGYGSTPIQRLWRGMSSDGGRLGSPFILERPYSGGRVTTFTKGRAWMDNQGRAFWADLRLAARYTALGPATVGWPTASQRDLPFGSMRYLKVAAGGAVVRGTNSAAWIREPIWSYLMTHTQEFAALGAPLSEERVIKGVRTQAFQRGTATVVNGRVHLNGSDPIFHRIFPKGFGDRNGDGRADLVGVNSAGQLVTMATTSGLKASSPVVRANGFGDVNWLAQIPDLNGDGTTDVLFRRTNGTLWLLPAYTWGDFAAPKLLGTGWGGFRSLAIMGDMTGDGRPNLLAIDGAGRLFRYSFTSTAQPTAKTLVGTSWGRFRMIAGFTDFTGDGTPDLLAVNWAGDLWAYSWQPQRNTWTWRKVGTGWNRITMLSVPGDVDGDGRVDLMGTWAGVDVQPFLNVGVGKWSPKPTWGIVRGFRVLG